ncbi:MAG: class I SAM-dependent methyltransferase [Oxalobacter sp.]|nr:MAG: class I SAM-dependent methyltransferase [Oxalobacter sp.]
MRFPESLPEPSEDALAASDKLCRLIADDITRQGGWISFARYMDLALYAPTLGYYAGGAVKLGRAGDFTTSPEITPLFGASLAQSVAALLEQTSPFVLEFGAGTGKLALDLLTELEGRGIQPERYFILEPSGELRARQQQLLKNFSQIEWIDQLPETFSGTVIGNEVLDAMPANLIAKMPGGWREQGVVVKNNAFAFENRACSKDLREYIETHIPKTETLPENYCTEVPLQALGFMRSVAEMIHRGESGAAIFIDYGFPSREYYLNQRCTGTLMCHYRHHAHSDPFFYPGLQDITAHVDFTALARTAEAAGLDILAYMNQASFLMASGIGDLLLRTPPEDAARYLPQANAVQMLLSPTEMGELFKVLVVGKNITLPEALARADRSQRL